MNRIWMGRIRSKLEAEQEMGLNLTPSPTQKLRAGLGQPSRCSRHVRRAPPEDRDLSSFCFYRYLSFGKKRVQDLKIFLIRESTWFFIIYFVKLKFMTDITENQFGAALEDIQSKMEAVLEIVSGQPTREEFNKLEDKVDSLGEKADTVEMILRIQAQDTAKLNSRVDVHEVEITKLKSKFRTKLA